MEIVRWFTILALSAILAFPFALAGVNEDTPVARVEVVDRPASACAGEPTPCIVQVRDAADPGDATVDLRMNVEYVGVGMRLEALRAAGIPVPDEDARFDARDLAVHHPVFTTLDSFGPVADRYDPLPQYVGISYQPMHPDRVRGIYVWGPTTSDPTFHRQDHPLATGGDEGWWQHDSFGSPVSEPSGEDTDADITTTGWFVCERSYAPEGCSTTTASTGQTLRDASPRVLLSFSYEETQVATNASNLSPPRTPGARALLQSAISPNTFEPAARAFDMRPDARERTDRPAPESAPLEGRSSEPGRITTGGQGHVSGFSPPPGRPPLPPLLLIAVGATATAFVLAALGFTLYSRITSARGALANSARDRIHDIIRASPGIHEAELTARSGLSRGSVRNHVAVLVRLGMVRVEKGAARGAFYPAGVRAVAPPDVAGFGHRRRVLEVLAQAPSGMTLAALCRAVPDVPRSTLAHDLARLEELGRVARADGRVVAMCA